MHLAIGTSLAIIAMKSGSGFLKYDQVLTALGQHVDWGRILLFAGLGFLGTLAGGALADRMPRARLQRLFAVFLVAMGVFILWQYAPAAF
jgi:uncharacterized membrane protein YfcA